MKLSLIFPLKNEAENLPPLLKAIYQVIKENGYAYEIIAVDDGSKDGSLQVLKDFAEKDKNLKIISFKTSAGQTAALSAGIEASNGDILIPMDADLENNPGDIPLLLSKIEEGYDVVSGWRKNRWQGKFFTRKLPSVIANGIISKITGVHLHDYGCTLKAYRRDIIQGVRLYGEMHRFIPAYAFWQGAKVTEVPVRYESRRFGRSNYNFSRSFRVILDLLVIKFLDKYMDRPIHFFGGLGFISLGIGIISGLAAVALKLLGIRSLVATPLPVFSALFIIVGVQLAAMGIVAEMVMRVYYETQNKKPYLIKESVNLPT